MFKQIFICILGLILTCSNTLAGPEMNAGEVELWATGLVGPSIEEKRLSGAVVTYVKDGEIRFSRGYGYADYLKKYLQILKLPGFVLVPTPKHLPPQRLRNSWTKV